MCNNIVCVVSRSGAETGWMDLTALAVLSVQLFDKDGGPIKVSEPIHVSVPLPSDTRNRMATSVPAWLYQPKTGEENIIDADMKLHHPPGGESLNYLCALTGLKLYTCHNIDYKCYFQDCGFVTGRATSKRRACSLCGTLWFLKWDTG